MWVRLMGMLGVWVCGPSPMPWPARFLHTSLPAPHMSASSVAGGKDGGIDVCRLMELADEADEEAAEEAGTGGDNKDHHHH